MDSLWVCLSLTSLLDQSSRSLRCCRTSFLAAERECVKERTTATFNSFYKQSIYFIYKANAVYCTSFISHVFCVLSVISPPKSVDAKNMRLLLNAERAYSDLTLIVLLHCFKVLPLRRVLFVVVFFGEERSVAILLGR